MKTRFDGLDVMAMVSHLQRTLLGRKVVNVYDGEDGDTYVFKLDNSATTSINNAVNNAVATTTANHSDWNVENDNDDNNTTNKCFLLLQSGVRFHDVNFFQPPQPAPSPTAAKLRKHLRGLRLEAIQQLGWLDRVVLFTFLGGSSAGSSKHHLVLELYAKGNLILTNADFQILSLLRSHVYNAPKSNNQDKTGPSTGKQKNVAGDSNTEQAVTVQVGHVYPVTYATTLLARSQTTRLDSEESPSENGVSNSDILSDLNLEWVQEQLQRQQSPPPASKKKAAQAVANWKTLLLRPSSGVSHYGPGLLEHCIRKAGVEPHTPLPTSVAEGGEAFATSLSQLREALQTEAPAVLQQLQDGASSPGFLLYQGIPPEKLHESQLDDSLPHPDKLLTDFVPILFHQHAAMANLQTRHFGQAVAQFFEQLQVQRQWQRHQSVQQAAQAKLSKVQQDQADRIEALQREQDLLLQSAKVVEQQATVVDQALTVINSALQSGMDWEQLEQVVRVEQENRNPVALLIHQLRLEEDAMVLRLAVDPYASTADGGESDDEDDPAISLETIDVMISLRETAHGNARELFTKYRNSKEKSEKTTQAMAKALEAAEETAKRKLQTSSNGKVSSGSSGSRKIFWFEKFRWFITSDNYLVVAGKDAHQNETLVKRYLRKGDAYLHADVHGAASCILRAKRRRRQQTDGCTTVGKSGAEGRTEVLPISDQALREAGHFTICHSSAWTSRMVTSAWWVEAHQVTKTAPTGEYLKTGSFMIRGKKNYLPPSPLEMGLAVLFALSEQDPDTLRRHENERRDFALAEYLESLVVDMAEVVSENLDNDGAIQEVTEMKGTLQCDSPNEGPEISNGEQQEPTAVPEFSGMSSVISHEPILENDENEESGAPMMLGVHEDNSDNETNGVLSLQSESVLNDDVSQKSGKSKKGLSVRDRRLIKKYGSLEEAERVLATRGQQLDNTDSASLADSISMASTSIASAATSLQTEGSMKRGKKAKLKRAKKKYSDQDEEDRELALLLLHGGEKKPREERKLQKKSATQNQTEAAAATATAALLSKSSAEVALRLPTKTREDLEKCLVQDDTTEYSWHMIDADILEQLVALHHGAQIAAVRRLYSLKAKAEIKNLSASLAGILRAIRKYGHENLEPHAIGSGDAKCGIHGSMLTENTDDKREEFVGMTNDDDDIDDTTELSKLTGKPVAEDLILFAVPVCAPYHTLSQYQFRVKLTPGNFKRGKAAKQAVDMFFQKSNEKSLAGGDRYKNMIKKITDNDWVQTICPDVKIAAAGAAKQAAKQKSKAKKKK